MNFIPDKPSLRKSNPAVRKFFIPKGFNVYRNAHTNGFDAGGIVLFNPFKQIPVIILHIEFLFEK